MIHIFSLDADARLVESSNPGDIAQHISDGRPFWVNLEAVDEDLLVDLLSDTFGFHELSIEDCIHRNQNAKIDEYPGYLFIVIHGICMGEGSAFDAHDLHMYLGANFLVTVYDDGRVPVHQIMADIRRNPTLLQRGSDWLLYQICDRVVDGYVPVMDRLDDDVEALESRVFARPAAGTLDMIFGIKKSVMHLRRLSVQQREIFLNLSRGRYPLINDRTSVYMRDVYDHLVRITDLVEGFRDLVAGSLDVYLSAASNRLNEIMKVLTIFSAIILPLNLLSSIYGMNFKHMPELEWTYGYPVIVSVMVVVTIGMLGYFRRRRWL